MLVKSITAFVTLLTSRFVDWVSTSAMVHTITVEDAGFELALVQWLVLRHELPDQHVLDHRIIAPDVCDGTSAVGESRHRIPDDPLVNRLNLAAKLILDAAERRMLPVLDLDLSVAIGRCDLFAALEDKIVQAALAPLCPLWRCSVGLPSWRTAPESQHCNHVL